MAELSHHKNRTVRKDITTTIKGSVPPDTPLNLDVIASEEKETIMNDKTYSIGNFEGRFYEEGKEIICIKGQYSAEKSNS